MAFDKIVFTQKELENALDAGFTAIALCDGQFRLPDKSGVSYTAIGDVDAKVAVSKRRASKLGITFTGFTPTFTRKNPSAKPMATYIESIDTDRRSFAASYSTSYTTSYNLSSYLLSGSFAFYYYTSYSGSFASSYASSYTTSYTGSFTASIFETHRSEYKEPQCILVNGYGINLI